MTCPGNSLNDSIRVRSSLTLFPCTCALALFHWSAAWHKFQPFLLGLAGHRERVCFGLTKASVEVWRWLLRWAFTKSQRICDVQCSVASALLVKTIASGILYDGKTAVQSCLLCISLFDKPPVSAQCCLLAWRSCHLVCLRCRSRLYPPPMSNPIHIRDLSPHSEIYESAVGLICIPSINVMPKHWSIDLCNAWTGWSRLYGLQSST